MFDETNSIWVVRINDGLRVSGYKTVVDLIDSLVREELSLSRDKVRAQERLRAVLERTALSINRCPDTLDSVCLGVVNLTGVQCQDCSSHTGVHWAWIDGQGEVTWPNAPR